MITTGIQSCRTVLLSVRSLKKMRRLWHILWTFKTFSLPAPNKIKIFHLSLCSRKIHTSMKLPSLDTSEFIVTKCSLSKETKLHGRMANGSPIKRRKSPIRKRASQRLIRERRSRAFLIFSLTGMHKIKFNFKERVMLLLSWQTLL